MDSTKDMMIIKMYNDVRIYIHYTHVFFPVSDVSSKYPMVVTMSLPKLTMYMSTSRNFLGEIHLLDPSR